MGNSCSSDRGTGVTAADERRSSVHHGRVVKVAIAGRWKLEVSLVETSGRRNRSRPQSAYVCARDYMFTDLISLNISFCMRVGDKCCGA